MKYFSVGDRVSVEGYDEKGVWREGKGGITFVHFDSALADVLLDEIPMREVVTMPIRCLRRLQKKVRREFWILEAMISHLDADVTTTKPEDAGYIHVREVPHGKA